MQYGCIGEHLPHSFSKEIHALLGEYPYELQELRPDEVGAFLTARDFRAVNVTIPYKQAVIPYLDRISDTARAVGAVNTVVNRNGVLWGHNTDYAGLDALARRVGVSFRDKKVLILGTGGTSKTALAAARDAGASSVLRVSRTGREGALTYGEALRSHTDAQIIVNTTPCGMYPQIGECPLALERFIRLEGVLDAVYNPLRTRLVQQAAALGVPAAGGLYMLVAQAVRASELFRDVTVPDGTAERVFDALLRQKENVVLIGMPGSGKSTVGALLSEQLGRPFYDTDDLVMRQCGCTPEQIIRTEGEEAFRTAEGTVIARLAVISGAVIATGGGAVLRGENVQALRQNGRLFWLDGPVSRLQPTADRPLTDTPERLRQRYAERYDAYRTAADVHIYAASTPESCAAAIRAVL